MAPSGAEVVEGDVGAIVQVLAAMQKTPLSQRPHLSLTLKQAFEQASLSSSGSRALAPARLLRASSKQITCACAAMGFGMVRPWLQGRSLEEVLEEIRASDEVKEADPMNAQQHGAGAPSTSTAASISTPGQAGGAPLPCPCLP